MDVLSVTNFEKLELLVFIVHWIHAMILSALFYYLLKLKLIFNLVGEFRKHRIILASDEHIIILLFFHLVSDKFYYFWLSSALKNLTY